MTTRKECRIEFWNGTTAVCSVVEPSAQTGPAPVALLLGWYQSQLKHVRKYSAIYEAMGYSTIIVTAPTMVVFAPFERAQEQFATALMDALVEKEPLKTAIQNSSGVVLHSFSNGGAFIMRRFDWLIHRSIAERVGREPWLDKMKRGEVFAAVVFDSCPVYMHAYLAVRAICGGVAKPNFFVWIAAWTVFAIMMLPRLFTTGPPGPSFFKDMIGFDLGCPELYIYSDSDQVMTADETAALIQAKKDIRKEQGRVDIREIRFADSQHVAHFQKHPDIYTKAIADVHLQAVNSFREERGRPAIPFRLD